MTERRAQLAATLARVRRRWRTVAILRSWAVAAAAAALVVGFALMAYRLFAPQNAGLVLLWAVAAAGAFTCLATIACVLRRRPTDVQFARFIEECCPELEDLLVTAVAERDDAVSRPLAAMVVDAAARRAADLDLERIVSRAKVRNAGLRAAAASLALIMLCGFAAGPAMRAAQLLTIYLFPDRLGLQVVPGDAKLRAGEPLRIIVRLPGSSVGVVPVLRIGDGGQWREQAMAAGVDGFVLALDRVEQSFQYAVRAAGRVSRPYSVVVIRPPHVGRIDLQYVYPAAFGMKPRVEEDSGDIFGPAGTRVRVSVYADKPVTAGTLNLSDGKTVALVSRGPEGYAPRAKGDASAPHASLLQGELTITDDGSYRVALGDIDGLRNPGETEYFIRTLEDRPPEVRIVKPAGDRKVTPLEEVPIEARADDDFGVASLDLVYAVRGQKEKAIPFRRSGSGQTINGRELLYLEDLKVQPGDFVTYYARARDVSRGKRSTEARSDIFFLEVTPFDEEFVSATSSSGAMPGGDASLEELIQAQKNVVTATWKLDRRAQDSGGRSADDIRTLSRAQAEVRRRTLGNVAEARRAAAVRTRRPGQGQAQTPKPAAADDPLSRAAEAMERAQQQLDALKTEEALPHEMTALNELMRAAAEDRRREVQRQQANGNGSGGSNRQQQDLSSLFDRELAREQSTNYETPTSMEARGQENKGDEEALQKVSELARRQEALNREQEQLARQKLSEEELKRQLERLTREQSELRQQAEQLSQQLQQTRQGAPDGKSTEGQQSGSGSSQGGQSTRSPSRPAESARNQEASRSLHQVSEEMRNATSDLRRQDPNQASESGSRALQRLRDLEGQMRGSKPDDRRRDVGDAQLESQQIADAQRRLANEKRQQDGSAAGGDPDAARRRAGEQDRLADRMQRLERSVRQLAGSPKPGETPPQERSALDEAARAIDRQKLSDRMRNAAKGEARGGDQQQAAARDGQEIAKALEDLSSQLGKANGGNDASRRLSDQLSRVKALRDKLAQLDRQLSELSKGGQKPGDQGDRQKGGQQDGPPSPQSDGAAGQGAGTSWQSARQLVDQLRGDERINVDRRQLEGFHPGLSAPGTEAWKQDFAKWDELKKQVTAALEKAEHTAAAQLRAQQAKDRLNAGTTQAVPEQYRRLVDKYYRALAAEDGR